MAQLKRSEIIALAKKWAGRKSQSLDLDDEFDFVTRDMSIQKPLLRTTEEGVLVADQNYIALPSDYRSQDIFVTISGYPTAFKIGDNWLPFLKSQAEFHELDDTMYGTPVLYAIMEDPGIHKIYFYPFLETDTPAYKFLYFKIHPKAWPAVDDVVSDKIQFGADLGVNMICGDISGDPVFLAADYPAGRQITISGSASNDGTYTMVRVEVVLGAYVLVVEEDVAEEVPGATVTISAESDDNYLHLYGEFWDNVVTNGVAMRAGNLMKEADIEDKYEARYSAGLREMNALVKARPYIRTVYHHF